MVQLPENARSTGGTSRISGVASGAAFFGAVFIAMVALAAMVRIDGSGLISQGGDSAPALNISSLDRLPRSDSTRDRLELLDPGPLFMPGLDVAPGAVAAELKDRPGGRVAELFGAAMFFKDGGAGSELLQPAVFEKTIEAVSAITRSRVFDGLARHDSSALNAVTKLREGKVEFYREGQMVPDYEFDLSSLPGVVLTNWRPMEFRLLVGANGIPVQLVQAASSGADELDAAVRAKLTKDLLLKVRLKPGNYRILAGP
jgi:hypothetical protein